MKYIYDLITKEEEKFRQPISITDDWTWSMKEQIATTVHYKNSIYKAGQSNSKPFKNILRPILNLQYRAEGFDVKDIILFIEKQDKYFKSFLIRKYHDKWAKENGLDTFIDNLVESYVDFGGALIKKTGNKVPEVVPLQRLAFCDQSDILSGPICEKHFYSSEELKNEAEGNGWKKEEVDLVITLSKTEKDAYRKTVKTPGKYIEVYELHGLFPRKCLYDSDEKGLYTGEYYEEDAPENELVRQVHICTYYTNNEGEQHGTSLYKGIEKENPYKLLLRDEIYGRALGLGGGEELFQDQIWTNYGMIRMKELLDAASKIIYKTTDQAFANRNKTHTLDQGEILVLEDGKDINQIDNFPRSTQLFDRFVAEWEAHARQMGAANESILGETPPSGTPFKLQELITAESHSLHEYRKGKIATFLEEIYREWIIPQIAKEVGAGKEFLAKLDLEELKLIANGLANSEANRVIKEMMLKGVLVDNEIIETFKAKVREEFMKGGEKRFLEIVKGEFKDADIDIEINIAGKQKDLSRMTDKLVNIFRTIVSSPAILQSPPMAKLFNQIIESSGLSPIDFSDFTIPQIEQRPPSGATKPLENLTENNNLARQIA